MISTVSRKITAVDQYLGKKHVLTVGPLAPNLNSPTKTGRYRPLKDYAGQHILLYSTPGLHPRATTEACNFRDDYSTYEPANVVILGVSPDTPASDKKFKEKYQLPFTLLADESIRYASYTRSGGRKKSFGNKYYGVHRTTYLIDPKGKSRKFFTVVTGNTAPRCWRS